MKILPRKMPDSYTMVQTQDWHIGGATIYMDGIKDCIGRIENKNVFVSLPGDLIEAIGPDDKRFSFSSHNHAIPTPQDQSREVANLLKPVASKTVGLGVGNHEWKLGNTWNVAKDICQHLKREDAYAGWSYVFRATDKTGKLMHKMFFTHGNFTLSSVAKDPVQALANMRAKLKKKLVQTSIADCIYMGCGHTHRLMVVEPTIDQDPLLVTTTKAIKNIRRYHTNQAADYIPVEARWYGNSGSFYKAYADPDEDIITYPEVGGMGALDFGWLEIDVEDRQVVNVRKVVV